MIDSSWLDDVDVAVVSHNGRSTLPRVLACLQGAGVSPARITLYDIASTDGTADWMRDEHAGATVVALPTNDGPNPARNLAIAQAHRPYLLLVDSDGYLRADAPAALRSTAGADASIGAVVPVVVHADRPDCIQYAGSRLHFLCEAITPFADQPLTVRGDADLDIGTAPGVCLLLNVGAARQVGAFDARYFMGKEDGEFCFRLRIGGYRIVECGRARVEHGSRPRSNWLFPYQIRNRWHLMLKNYEWQTLAAITPALLIHEPLQFLVLLVKGEIGAWFRAVRGLWGLLGSLGCDRAGVGAIRRMHDRTVLAAAPLVIRSDVAGGRVTRGVKRLYDGWLAGYWALASRLLP